MAIAIRFHLDEHVNPAIAHGLRRRGIDVTTTADAELLGAADSEHFNFANSHGRVLVTRDDDFLKLGSEGIDHSGIAFWPPSSRSLGEVIGYLELMHACVPADEMRGRIEYL